MEITWLPKRPEPCDTAPTTEKPSSIVTRTVPAPTRHGHTPEIRTTAAQSTVTTITDRSTPPVTQPRMGGQSNATKSSHPPRHETSLSKLEPTEPKSDNDNHCTGHSSLSKRCHQRNVDKMSKQDQDMSVTTKPTPTHTESNLAMSSSPSAASTASSLMQKPLTTSHVRTELPHFKSQPKFDSPRNITAPRQPNSRGSQSSWYSHTSRRTPQLPYSAYKKKYHKLLNFEEESHKEILKSCDGEFTLKLFEQKHESTDSEPFSTYACLCDLHDSKIAYVTQAAEVEKREGVLITMKDGVICAAHILYENYNHTEQKLYIAFDEENALILESYFKHLPAKSRKILVKVNFQLKSSYFRSLHICVNNLPLEVIQRLESFDHKIFSLETSEKECENYKQLLDTEQRKALNAILGEAPPNSPPILISGPFGTGKTRVMAIAAHKLFERNYKSARILVCTQQRESADNFMSIYLKEVSSSGSKDTSVEKLILRDYGPKKRWLYKHYVNPEDLSDHLNASVKKLLIVTTCLTAHHLRKVDTQFSHIFIDEGAQMREPEAVAALAFANHNTKIVIAGDPQQVGPAMLVFGTQAKQGGLDKSLLERLISEYKQVEKQSCSKKYHITLVTNYRCHEDIRNLSSCLFYHNTLLKLPCKPNNQPPSFGLHGSSSSLHFLCSSFSEEAESDINEEEAEAVLNVVVDISRSRPNFTVSNHKVCIMSKPRSQLRTINNLMRLKFAKELLLEVKTIPTFSMQGNEYCALVLSTSEHLKEDGAPVIDSSKSLCNPYVFNTAITRAESLVVAVGNPFLLLKTEKHMLRDPNYKEKGKCWSNFLSHCIEHGTVTFSKSLKVSEEEKEVRLSKLNKILEERLEKPVKFISPAQRSHVTILDNIYSPECKLGDGGFGVVLKVKRLTDGYDLAIKLKLCVKDEKKTQDEAIKLRKLSTRHPINIVQYLDSGLARRPDWSEWQEWLTEKKSRMSVSSGTSIQGIDDSDLCFYILTEWCEEGTLEDWLRSNAAKKHRDRTTICNFLEQILQALKFIHEENLAHRDLKPSNIFFKSDGTLKVGDFGLVKDIDEECMAESSVPLPSEGDNLLSKHYGTNPYRSPELRNKRPRPEIDWKKTDIYALGVIFFELCWIIKSQLERDKILNRSNGLLPVDAKLKAQLPEGFREEHCDEAAELVLLMTSFDPAKRPTAEEILEGALLSSLKELYTMAPPPPEQPSMASMVQQSPSKGKKKKQRSGSQSKQKERQVPSNSIRDLSSKQTRRREEVKSLEDEDNNDDQVFSDSNTEAILETTADPEVRVSTQQTRPPGAQQTRPSATQQTRPPGAQQTHPSGVRQSSPIVVRQTRPKSTSQLAASPIHNKHSSQPQPNAALAGKRSEARPSKLRWGDEEDSGLAPGAIESPAEFPPLGASPKGKRKKQRSGSQSKQKERQVPSNSLRDLSSKQTRRREEVKIVEDEDNNDDQVFTNSNTEAILETIADPETKQEVSNTSAQHSHRFEKEFIVKEVLGQGGFGVVFHVKSNFDHSDYALKLTRLPDDNDERLKVMREVRVLAKLVQESHPHVVRYNTSWEEQAPHEWRTRDHWALLETSEILTTSSSKRDSQSTSGVDTFCHITSSSAATHSSSTVQSIGAATNESSDSFIEFRDDSQRSSNTKHDKAATPLGKPAASNPDDVFTPHVGSKENNTVVMNPPMVLMIQTELCEKYTLKDWLLEHIRDRQKRTVVDFFDQMLDALCFIHKERDRNLRFVHRDLKPSNIFFARGKKNFLKIGDFGLVKGTNVIDPSVQNPLRDLSSRQQRSPSMNAQGYYAGTPLYMSPEQKQGKACDQKADMYALGVIFFELNCPFKTESERYKVLVQLNEDSENLPKGFRDKLQNEVTTIIQLLMHRNPNMRPSADEIRADKHGELRRLKKKVGKKSKPSLIPVL